MKSADPDVVVHGAVFEDGVGLTRAMLKADFTPDMVLRDHRARRSASSTPTRSARRTPRASCSPSATRRRADTPGNAEFVAKYKEMYDGAEPPEDAADAYAAAQVHAGRGRGRRQHRRPGGDGRSGCATTRSTRSSAPLSWDDDGAPQGDFLIGQWQDGEVAVRAPRGVRHHRRARARAGCRAAPADDRVPPDPPPRPAAGRRLRPGSEWADPDLRRHEGDQHRPWRLPDPGGLHHLHALGRRWASTRCSPS